MMNMTSLSKFQNLIQTTSIFGLIFSFALSGCNDVELTSAWRNHEIIIDGSEKEWQDNMVYLSESKIALGIRNDEDFLYLCMVVGDRNTDRKIMGRGFTVWFDADGGKERTFGVHYPLGMQGEQPQFRGQRDDGEPGQREQFFQQMSSEMEILGPGKDDRLRMPLPGTNGIAIKMARAGDNLVYEIRVPFRKNSEQPYAIGTAAGKQISIGFETGDINMEMFRNRVSEEEMSSRDVAGPPRSDREGERTRSRQDNAPLKLWATVQLTEKDYPKQ